MVVVEEIEVEVDEVSSDLAIVSIERTGLTVVIGLPFPSTVTVT